MKVVLQVSGLRKQFQGKEALKGIDLNIAGGEIFTLLGPNGAGKTTLLKLICGLLRPSSGDIKILGLNLEKDPVTAKRHLSFIPDHPDIHERLTGWEYLSFVASAYGMGRNRWPERAEGLLEYFELDSESRSLIGTYSHGMRQRLCFVAAFLPEPELLLIDEPWVGLDPRHLRKAIEALRRTAKRGGGILLSTHSLSLAERIGGRIGILNEGGFVWDGSKEDLLEGKEGLEEIFLNLTQEDE